jgi:Na+/H+ antiporter NhaD/arsenite permease-like protein
VTATTTPTTGSVARPSTEPFRWLVGAAAATVVLTVLGASPSTALDSFPFQVVALYVGLDLYTEMVRDTGLLDLLAVRAARTTRTDPRRLLVVFGGLLMAIGIVNNNLTALLISFPVLSVVLRSLRPSPRYIALVLAMLLAVGNCAGASTPIGDFPALLIMDAGITSFLWYLALAFPLFLLTASALVLVYRRLAAGESSDEGAMADAAVALPLLEARNRHRSVDAGALAVLGAIFLAMALCWAIVPFETVPPALVAWAGVALACVLVAPRGIGPSFNSFDLDVVLRMAAVFYVAGLIATTDVLDWLTRHLQSVSDEPVIVLLALMAVTTLVCAVVDAGGAAAALLPVVTTLTAAGEPLADIRHIAVVGFAAAICAGSSMFLTSATAGQLLSVKAQTIETADGEPMQFGVRDYLRYGLMNASVQFVIAVAWAVAATSVAGWLR